MAILLVGRNALDHADGLVADFALFKRRPTSAQACAFLGRANKM